MKEEFSWVQTHKELVEYLKTKEDSQEKLVEILKNVGVKGLHDEKVEGERVELKEIDPFTFFCFIYKHKSEENSLATLTKIADSLNLTIPEGVSGTPFVQPLMVMMFFYGYERDKEDISNLWKLFYQAINHSIDGTLFEKVLNQKGVGKAKLTEALFFADPEHYFPIDGPSKPFLKKVYGIDPDYSSYSDYKSILDDLKSKSNKPLYELSYDAYIWNNDYKKDQIRLEKWEKLIDHYKKHQQSKGIASEIYKWEAVQHFQDTFDLEAEDFASNLKDAISKSDNLVYHNSKEFINKAAKYFPEEVREMFKELYNESQPLADRLEQFTHQAELLQPKVSEKHGKELNHQQDERTLSFYLTMRFPDKYPIYKADVYQYLLSEVTEEDSKSAGEKFLHYLKLAEVLVPAIEEDQELINSITDQLNEDCFTGEQKWLIFQDILWVNMKNRVDRNYWLFQGNPSIFDIEQSLKDKALSTWRVTAHKDNIKPGDKVILWASGDRPGVYALAEVESEVKEDTANEKELAYYKNDDQDEHFEQVELKVTHNLAHNPITYDQIKNVKKLSGLKIGNQGTNFSATKEEYEAFLNILSGMDDEHIHAKVIHAYLMDGKSHRDIQEDILDMEAPAKGGGFAAMDILHLYDIQGDKKGILKSRQFNKVFRSAKGSFKKGLSILKKYYPQLVIGEKMLDYPLNTIFYGPPGTGKTYSTIKRAAEIVEGRKIDNYDEAKRIFNDQLSDTIEFITFHQNYSYEDFIQGLRPDIENSQQLTFERTDGLFKQLADKALKNWKASRFPQTKKESFERVFNKYINPLVEGEVEEIEVEMKRVSYYITAVTDKSIEFRKSSGGTAHTLSINTLRKMYEAESVMEIQGLSSYYTPLLDELLDRGKSPGETEQVELKNYVIIIDEINRANISRVFGELITLIEPDKRFGRELHIPAKLPSGESFSVPENLYIIGTMNTADKSIALLDIALRRRFDFEAMYPKYIIDGKELADKEILQKINERIIKLKGHDFQIGHSYFMDNELSLKKRMNRKVIPLLLEYFMNDEDEVKDILKHAGLDVEEKSWPIRITGKK